MRAAIPLAGPVAVAVLGCALAGPAVTVRAVGPGFGQVLRGGIGPLYAVAR